jgi:cytochrome b561
MLIKSHHPFSILPHWFIYILMTLALFVIEPNQTIKKIFKEIHQSPGTSLYYLIGIHALAALWQHDILKGVTLRSMPNKLTQ